MRIQGASRVPLTSPRFPKDDTDMKDILRTTDPVLLSFAESMLRAAGIPVAVFDTHTSAVEGSISAIPRRLMVADEDVSRAQAIIDAAVTSRA
jgi:hypothetical protein